MEVATPLCEGRYRLLAVLGEGGMAVVFGAWDDRLGVHRAVKVLNPVLAHHESIRRRFDIEARTMARLHHPHIVTVHDVGVDGGRAYIVMELLSGGTLMRRVEKHGPLPPRMATSAMVALLDALQYAHDHGVVHRDIKPHNVMLTAEGVPKVTDFGIARVADAGASLTRTGSTMGTPAYMAPEQRGDASHVDGRADIFSAGASLYTLLTGKEPFDIYAVEHQNRLLTGVPGPLADVIRRAVSYSPDERYPRAADMSAALRKLAETLPPDPEDATPLGVPVAEPWRSLPLGSAPHTTPPEEGGLPRDLPAFPSIPGVEARGARGGSSMSLEDVGGSGGSRRAVSHGAFWTAVGLSVLVSAVVAAVLVWWTRPEPAPPVAPSVTETTPLVQPETPVEPPETPVDPAPEASSGGTGGGTGGGSSEGAQARSGSGGGSSGGSTTRTSGSGGGQTGSQPVTPSSGSTASKGSTPSTGAGTSSAAAGSGMLIVNSRPTHAAVFVDNKYQGETKWEGSVPAGVRRLVLENEETGRHEIAIHVVKDGETRYCWDFQREATCRR